MNKAHKEFTILHQIHIIYYNYQATVRQLPYFSLQIPCGIFRVEENGFDIKLYT